MRNNLLATVTGTEDNSPLPQDEDTLELDLQERDLDTAAKHAVAVTDMVDELDDNVQGMEALLGGEEWSADKFRKLYERSAEITNALELAPVDVLGSEAYHSSSSMMLYGYAGVEGFVKGLSDGLKKLLDVIIGIFTKIKDFIAGIFTSGEHKSKAVTQAVAEIKKKNFKGHLKLSGAQLKGVFESKDGRIVSPGHSNNLWNVYSNLRDLLHETAKVIGDQGKVDFIMAKVSPMAQAFAAAKQHGKKISEHNGVATYRTKMGNLEIDWTFLEGEGDIKNEEDLSNRISHFGVKLRHVPVPGDYEVDVGSALKAIEDVNKFAKDNLGDLNKQSADALNIAKNLQSRIKSTDRTVLLSTKVMIAVANTFSKLTTELARDLTRRLSAAESLTSIISTQVKKGE